MNPWSHLPNARHIDWVFQSGKDNPQLWAAARDAARGAAWDAAFAAAWNAARDAARLAALDDAARDAARDAALDAALDVAVNAAVNAALYAALDALAALVAYDDCDGYLSMTYEQLHAWALLSETPQAVLLLPLKWVQEHEHETLVTSV